MVQTPTILPEEPQEWPRIHAPRAGRQKIHGLCENTMIRDHFLINNFYTQLLFLDNFGCLILELIKNIEKGKNHENQMWK